MEREQGNLTIYNVRVPSAGESVQNAKIAIWHVEDGAQVKLGDTLVKLETDKVSTEIESEFFGRITRLFPENTTVSIGDAIAEIVSTEEDLKHTEKAKSEQPVHVSESMPDSKTDSSTALFKLVALVVIAFLVMKYGVPLVTQISEKSSEALDKKKTEHSERSEEEKSKNVSKTSPPATTVRITRGYEAWEPAVREQLEEWHADVLQNGSKYKLTNIDVNDEQDVMEVRYRLIAADGITVKSKLTLTKDGFGKRFIYTEENKEFLVYPPE